MHSDLAWVLGWPWLMGVAAAFGALWGSFFNVVVARLPRGESVVRPGSRCFSCGTPVRAYDNIPVLSWFLLRGKCRSCGARFSIRYALVELAVAGLAALLWWRCVLAAPEVEPSLRLVRFVVFFAFVGVLVVLALIDLDTKRLPDIITLPSIPLFFLAGFAVHDVGWMDRLIGLAAGYAAVRLIADVYYYSTGREGLGLGDGKLLAVIGALLGWRALPPTVFAASFIGVIVSLPLLVVARARARKEDEREAAAPVVAPPVAVAADAAEGGGGAPALAAPALEAGPAPPETAAGAESESRVDEDDNDDDTPLRQVEVPFGPFLVLAALVYMFFWPPIWGAITRLILGSR